LRMKTKMYMWNPCPHCTTTQLLTAENSFHTPIQASRVFPAWGWNSSLIWTRSISLRDTMIRISTSSFFPPAYILIQSINSINQSINLINSINQSTGLFVWQRKSWTETCIFVIIISIFLTKIIAVLSQCLIHTNDNHSKHTDTYWYFIKIQATDVHE